MTNRELRVHYHDSGCILVINPKGKIRKLYTPFRVLCIESVNKRVKKGAWVFVDEVKASTKGQLIFVVAGLAFSHRHFQIQINF